MPSALPYLHAVEPYQAGLSCEAVRIRYGLSRIVQMSSNESPLGPSPKALDAIGSSLVVANRYPDSGLRLREELAGLLNRDTEEIILGAGSEGVLSDILTAFMVPGDEALTTEAAFIGFTTMARARGLVCRTAPYRDWCYDLDALSRLVTDETKLVYLANPNNPTGTAFTQPEFDHFMRRIPERVLIVLDEAYFEYAHTDLSYPDSTTPRYSNLITLRTFSKAYGLAGLRIGYGVGPGDLIRSILKVKLPFEPSGPALAAGLAALSDGGFLDRVVALNASGRLDLQHSLSALGFQVVPSQANFVMLVTASHTESQRVFELVLSQGVIVRPLKAFGLPSCLRITTALEEENQFCIEAFARA